MSQYSGLNSNSHFWIASLIPPIRPDERILVSGARRPYPSICMNQTIHSLVLEQPCQGNFSISMVAEGGKPACEGYPLWGTAAETYSC